MPKSKHRGKSGKMPKLTNLDIQTKNNAWNRKMEKYEAMSLEQLTDIKNTHDSGTIKLYGTYKDAMLECYYIKFYESKTIQELKEVRMPNTQLEYMVFKKVYNKKAQDAESKLIVSEVVEPESITE